MYPPVAFPPPPPTSNTLSSYERSTLVRSSRKLYKVLGDLPRVLDDDTPLPPSRPSTPSSILELNRANKSTASDTESAWRKRKPTNLPPLLKFCSGTLDPTDSPDSPKSPMYHPLSSRPGSVLSVAPSIISNVPSTASSDSAQRRTKLERLRRKLGDDVPATAVFPATFSTIPATSTPTAATPRTPRVSTSSKKTSRGRTCSVARPADARSIAFSISSDESVHSVTFTTRVRSGSPHPHKTKHVFRTGALPPVPPLPAYLRSSGGSDEQDAGLLRPRPKTPAGSMIGNAEFKAARRAKRECKFQHGKAEPGELVEMVGFLC